MPLIKKEKDLLYEITCKHYCGSNREKYLREADAESYYLEPGILEEEYLQEYDFQMPAELKDVLKKLFVEKELPMEYITPVMVAMLKLKGSTDRKEVLMETIYNF